jgi:hypothetical protein
MADLPDITDSHCHLDFPDFDGQVGDPAPEAQRAGGDVQLGPQGAGVGFGAHEVDFELVIGVAAVVAQEAQGPGIQGQQQVGVPVEIEVRRGDGGDRGALRHGEAEGGGGGFEPGGADIAPRAQGLAVDQDIEPTVVVIIQEEEAPGLCFRWRKLKPHGGGRCAQNAVEGVR